MKKLLLILALLAYVAISCDDKPNTLTGGDDEPSTEQPGDKPADSTDPGQDVPDEPEYDGPTASFFAYIDMLSPVPLGLHDDEHPKMPKYGYLWIVDDSTNKYIRQSNLSSFEMLYSKDSVKYIYNPNDLIGLFKDGSLTAIKSIEHNHGWLDSVPYGDYYIIAAIGIPYNDTIKTFTGSSVNLTIDSTTINDTVTVPNCGWLSPGWLSI